MAGIRGDFRGLDRLIARAKEATANGGSALRTKMAQRMGASALKLIADEFQGEHDPYGDKWKPLARERARNRRARRRGGTGGQKILSDTGRLRTSFSPRQSPLSAGPWGFRIGVPVSYAAAHQFGARIMPYSRARPQYLWLNPKNGRFVSRRTKLKTVIEIRAERATFANGITIPARPMLPTKERGLPPTWAEAFRKDAAAVMREALGKAGG